METIIKLSALAKKMKKKPLKSKIYSFFEGANNMTESQINNMSEIIKNENDSLQAFLNEQKKRIS